MNNLDKARVVAEVAHAGQLYGQREYIFHLTECVMMARALKLPETIQIALYLHDVVEDSKINQNYINAEFSPQVATIVFHLTKDDRHLTLDQYYNNIGENLNCVICKMIDRTCNLNNINPSLGKLASKYIKEDVFFQNFIKNIKDMSEPILLLIQHYQKAMDKVKSMDFPFKWTDEKAIEFAKITNKGSYGDYKDCKTVESKLKRFKALENGSYPK